MKKEYLILIGVIVLACVYLFTREESRDHYTLPEIEKIDTSQLTSILITKENETIFFQKENSEWTVTEEKLPTDRGSVQDMLDTVKTFKLTTLVSQKKDFQRYELDDKKRVLVEFKKGTKTIFKMTIGKLAPGFNHTFVMVNDDTNIYHANGSFRGHFNRSADDFKKVEEKEEEKETTSNPKNETTNDADTVEEADPKEKKAE